jgi:hypothetical protein
MATEGKTALVNFVSCFSLEEQTNLIVLEILEKRPELV